MMFYEAILYLIFFGQTFSLTFRYDQLGFQSARLSVIFLQLLKHVFLHCATARQVLTRHCLCRLHRSLISAASTH